MAFPAKPPSKPLPSNEASLSVSFRLPARVSVMVVDRLPKPLKAIAAFCDRVTPAKADPASRATRPARAMVFFVFMGDLLGNLIKNILNAEA